MKKSAAGDKGRAMAIQGMLLAITLSGLTTAGQTQEVRRVPVSLDASTSHGQDMGDTLSHSDLQRTFRARCPGRVERLLSTALPTERPDFKAIADICTCATTAMENAPQSLSVEQFRVHAAQAALTCSKGTITTHNAMRTRRTLGAYLSAQGLDAQQVAAFSQCAAATHWKYTVDAAPEGSPPEGRAWWGPCTEQIGRKGLPEPQY